MALAGLALPPRPMPGRDGLRPLKAWRYVLVVADELMLCAARVRVGPARQTFWALWDRELGELRERTSLGAHGVELPPGGLRIPGLVELALDEQPGVETICPSGASYAWTRKQGGIAARGQVGGRPVEARAIVDDTAAYYERRTRWRWSAGVGRTGDGRALAWNLVEGVNDPPRASERTVWLDGVPREAPPQPFAADLRGVGELRFCAEATLERREHRLLVRSRYRQPFGRFEGTLPGGLELAEGLGVMEEHDAVW